MQGCDKLPSSGTCDAAFTVAAVTFLFPVRRGNSPPFRFELDP
jgi:hypothetical protein